MSVTDVRKRRKVTDIRYDRAKKGAEETGLTKVPECFFLVLDKPRGRMAQMVVNQARTSLGNVYEDALMMRYLEYQAKHLVRDKRTGLRTKDGKKLKSLAVDYAAGRSGLDPLVSGLLPLAFEGAIKLLHQFMDGMQEYECTAQFGVGTDVDDLAGKMVGTGPFLHVTKELLESEIQANFLGDIMQVPPTYPSFKMRNQVLVMVPNKKAAKEHAQPQTAHIGAFEVLEVDVPRARFRIECSRGTYIRALIRDLALAIGSRATCTSVRRTRCGVFTLEQSISGDENHLKALGNQLSNHIVHANSLVPGSWNTEKHRVMFLSKAKEGAEAKDKETAHKEHTVQGNAECESVSNSETLGRSQDELGIPFECADKDETLSNRQGPEKGDQEHKPRVVETDNTGSRDLEGHAEYGEQDIDDFTTSDDDAHDGQTFKAGSTGPAEEEKLRELWGFIGRG
ncbi:tRNA pseudouridine synthase B [Porphyridium purpureum]|uniref:tRNA pseudouridine(55) synthase n=1 Tax=Porphyridium purpureum TaxID=35688 RepID=A0A5J4YKE4_PORPP|nr:tRNA pseudouridine synthase B [Porphyridium purpureum]|eukprot:POR2669..scf244_11